VTEQKAGYETAGTLWTNAIICTLGDEVGKDGRFIRAIHHAAE
jgi:hypothetical protein